MKGVLLWFWLNNKVVDLVRQSWMSEFINESPWITIFRRDAYSTSAINAENSDSRSVSDGVLPLTLTENSELMQSLSRLHDTMPYLFVSNIEEIIK